MTAWPVFPYLLAAGFTWAGLVVVDGWQRVRAERRNELRALRRIYERRG